MEDHRTKALGIDVCLEQGGDCDTCQEAATCRDAAYFERATQLALLHSVFRMLDDTRLID